MTVSLTRLDDTAFQIMAFRSMARTLVHDLDTAMSSVTALAKA
jgi:sarcosine oxidase subunit gamma